MSDAAPSLWDYLDPSWDAVVVIDERGTLLRVNARAEAMFGRSRDVLVGQPLDVLIPGRFHEKHAAHVAQYVAAPSFRPMCLSTDVRGARADGTEFPVEISLFPVSAPGGLEIVASIREPRPLAESEQRLAAFLELAPDAMMVVDEAGSIRLANGAAERLFGRHGAELRGLEVAALVPEPARSRHGEHLRAFFANPRARPMGQGLELVALASCGREIPVEISLAPVEVGGRRMAVAAIRDVSERRRGHAELRIASERLEAAFEMAKLGVIELDVPNDRRHYSRGTLALLGVEASHADGRTLLDVVHPDDRARAAAATEQAKRDGLPYEIEMRMRRSDGCYRSFKTTVRPERDAAGAVTKLWALMVDVTDEREAAAALAETHARLEALLASAPNFILYCDLDGVIRFANRAIAPLTVGQIVGRPWLDFLPPDQESTGREAVERALGSTEPVEIEVPAVFPEGSWFSCHIGRVMRDGAAVGFVILARDITARKHAETQLAAAEQLSSLGMMSGALAHELNNPLAAALWGLDFVAGDGDAGLGALEPAQREAFKDTRDALGALRAIVHDLKLFAGAARESERAVDVNSVLETTLRLARNEIRHRARVRTVLGDLPPVAANEGRLGQVFLNLLVNAAHAIPEGDTDRHEICVTTRLDPDGRVRVEIRDTGVGMSPDVRARLFTPFFTTKPVGIGTGLGLSICQRIVAALGGEIVVESAPGVGSTFSVLLPAGPTPVAIPPARARRPASRARVLLLDDDAALVRALVRRLRPHHDVVGAMTALEAYAILQGAPVDVIVCDVMMPETTGGEFFDVVSRRWPGLESRFVFLTGGAFTDGAREFLRSSRAPVLTKPAELTQLLDAIEACREATERG